MNGSHVSTLPLKDDFTASGVQYCALSLWRLAYACVCLCAASDTRTFSAPSALLLNSPFLPSLPFLLPTTGAANCGAKGGVQYYTPKPRRIPHWLGLSPLLKAPEAVDLWYADKAVLKVRLKSSA